MRGDQAGLQRKTYHGGGVETGAISTQHKFDVNIPQAWLQRDDPGCLSSQQTPYDKSCRLAGDRRLYRKRSSATPFSTTSEEMRPRHCSFGRRLSSSRESPEEDHQGQSTTDWKELCLDVDQNLWGLGYLIVTRKLGTNTQGNPQDARTLDQIVHTLFPSQPKREISLDAPGIIEVPQFTEEELLRAASSMRNEKAPGPVGLPAEIIKVVAQSHPELLQNIKGKGPVGAASSYRPICMLDTAGKLLEKLLMPRLHAAVKAAGDLAGRQYGFRSGLSTIHAVQEVVTASKMMERSNYRTGPLCLLATLDVRNAFNSVKWELARKALERNFGVPNCHYRKRHGGGTVAAPSGHVESFFLDGSHGLFLAVQETEVVPLTGKRINTLRSFIVGDAAVQTNSDVKYLGVMLDNKLNYGKHIIRADDKAAKVVASLGKLMANVNGPRPSMRRLLMRAAEAVTL
ncbi:uncharacterized protein LOC118450548 [Vespa mandarinia]|uniref:uncharacterized protein LOC118450548 n=1 Tax=Vespa mandarinia TaxID=7446 RepID=UPI001610396E|nr:uncharacterized protein LOC118450548 [Vespa mandarinia]